VLWEFTMGYSTKELSLKTWPDFEDLFSRGNGWDFCACMLNPRGHHLPPSRFPDRAAMKVRNLADMHDLVGGDQSHGILVYSDGRPIGWCQFGTVDELPRWTKKLGQEPQRAGSPKAWRITCFVTDKEHRRVGVARRALRAALEAIRQRGGGVVEAYPLVWELDDQVSELFPEEPQTSANWFRARDRGGNVPGANGGGLAMFLEEGFAAVEAIPAGPHERRLKAPPQVVVRRRI
jgi:ribosomal protein S18 acetylase RimI-like enzyme